MSKKSKQQQQTTSANTYGQIAPQDTPDIIAARAYKPQIDPSIGYGFSQAAQNVRRSYDNPFGAATSAAGRDAGIRTSEENLGQAAAQAMREAYAGLSAQEMAQKMALAELTAPRIVQTGGTSSSVGTTTQPSNILGGLLSAAVTF